MSNESKCNDKSLNKKIKKVFHFAHTDCMILVTDPRNPDLNLNKTDLQIYFSQILDSMSDFLVRTCRAELYNKF